jgi:regulator of nucleoside diphosphate kinase
MSPGCSKPDFGMEVAPCFSPGATNQNTKLGGKVLTANLTAGMAEATMSDRNNIYITEFDMKRLKGLIKFARDRWDKRVVNYLEELDEELDRAEVVRPEEIPMDVITMNSTFRLIDVDSGEHFVYTLVFPAQADSANGKISILAPVGTAVLGCRVGDTVEWKVPAGLKKLRVKGIIYQPEAAGDYHC